MKFPVTIRILGYDYRIEYLEYQREVDTDFGCDNYLGTCDCDAGVIRILATASPLAVIDTLIHEVLHAIFTRNKMLKTAVQPDVEENFIATLASEFALLLFDNKLVDFSTESPPITTRIVPEARP